MYRLKVKEVAEAKGISMRKLFMRSEVDIQIVRRVFRTPYNTGLTLATLDKFAKVLGVNINELVESVYEDDQEQPEQ
jgi:DNA-binding Xre family transcriptional regulator